MMNKILLPNQVDPNHKGTTLYLKNGNKYHAALRIEVSSDVAFSVKEYEDFHSKNLPYIPNSESSIYVKTPQGATYESNFIAKRFDQSQGVTVDPPNKPSQKIYDPYLSWHGGTNRTDSKGTISLRGYANGNIRTRHLFNESEAIAKDSLAGNYNLIAQVALPRILSSLPKPVAKTSLVSPFELKEYNDSRYDKSVMIQERIDLVIESYAVTNKGLCVAILAHTPSPLHKSRFSDHDRAKWLVEPITLFPNDKAPLACSLLFIETETELVLDDAPIIFMGFSVDPSQNIAFSAFKINPRLQ